MAERDLEIKRLKTEMSAAARKGDWVTASECASLALRLTTVAEPAEPSASLENEHGNTICVPCQQGKHDECYAACACEDRGHKSTEPTAAPTELQKGYAERRAPQPVAANECFRAFEDDDPNLFDRGSTQYKAQPVAGEGPQENMKELTFNGSWLDMAICLAVKSHAGQVDKSRQPYILHPLRVMAAVAQEGEATMIAAVLHDAVEDTELSLESVKAQFGEEVGGMVDAVSRRKGEETYREFIQRVKLNPQAAKIKIADLRDNLSRIENLPPSEQSIRQRYEKALIELGAATEGTPKLEEIAELLAHVVWEEVYSILGDEGLALKIEAAVEPKLAFQLDRKLRPFITPASSPERVPDGYAYRYHDCIRMNHGEEVNGGKHIEAIPYFLLKPPATPACSTDQAIRYGGALSFKSWLKMHTPLFSHQVNQVVDAHEAFAATPASTGERDADESYAECSDKAVKLLAIIENAVDYEEGCEAVFELRKLLPNIDRYVKDEVADQIEKLSTGEANGWISVEDFGFPSIGDWCWVVISGTVQRIAAYFATEEWHWADEDADNAPKEVVTHWMYQVPVPPAPTSVRQAELPK